MEKEGDGGLNQAEETNNKATSPSKADGREGIMFWEYKVDARR